MPGVELSRRTLLVGATAAMATTAMGGAQQNKRPAALEPDLVRDFVIAAHGDLAKTKDLLTRSPGLLNATWDWGGGDFESAIGGAGHMGRHDIARYLIGKGATYGLHVAAMLSELEVVKAVLTAHPNLIDSPGPHGITLLVHAEKGGEEAAAVLSFLKSLKGS